MLFLLSQGLNSVCDRISSVYCGRLFKLLLLLPLRILYIYTYTTRPTARDLFTSRHYDTSLAITLQN